MPAHDAHADTTPPGEPAWRLILRGAGLAFGLRVWLVGFAALVLSGAWGGWPDPYAFFSSPRYALGAPLEAIERCLGLLAPPGVPSYHGGVAEDVAVGETLAASFAWLARLLVWGFALGVVARIAALRLTIGERIGLKGGLGFVAGRWKTLLAAQLFACLVVAAPLLLLKLFTLPQRFGVGEVVSAALWPVALVLSLLWVVLAGALVIGWPLLVASIAVERADALDSLSRMFAYVTQRPLRLVAYIVMAAAVGWAGGMLVEGLASGAVAVSRLSGAGFPILKPAMEVPLAERMIRGWTELFMLVARGYYPAFLATAGTAIYLLLRRDIDEQEADEVFVEE
ncbi:hypothetical protein Mal64_04970 [Pseudobythopirellula maris]|uniref:Uncharacterized protein n=1 Tax=Pseudobythopirellula maris TaxID=2527991 RepID=A0A5C5ZRI0_9BACT|nr:hypothetical protein [Pseudobythopirellula maris]TWT90114.1 hypothetical protein Mal64_04970 [Pseudobythopirellula maris]